ncbi:MAG: amidohydrolase family protein [Bifidobacteriaceae bacterium]|jgi:N-acyl-D-amino-acid deacylase|nr:amidohydrolase family protein [Bifidobacteriaceae bacterium]
MTAGPTYRLAGGLVADGDGGIARLADVVISDGRVAAITRPSRADGAEADDCRTIDCAGRVVMPGMIDIHSHADDAIFDDSVQHALLRQGVTTVVVGQDGVSYAPGDGSYAGTYFEGLIGRPRHYRGDGVAGLLSGYDGRTRVNVAYAVPLGTVRQVVAGHRSGPATPVELAAMERLVRQGLEEGAVGVSSGLDYTPGLFADAAELGRMAAVAAGFDKPYITHMRGGYEDNAPVGISEALAIARSSGAAVHISHFHGDPGMVLGEVERLNAGGCRGTFDAYPYRRGCTLLAMLTMPPELMARGSEEVVRLLEDRGFARGLATEWFPQVARRPDLGPAWMDRVTYSSVDADALRGIEGLTVAEAGRELGEDPRLTICRVLAATQLRAVVVARNPRPRTDSELAQIFESPHHTGGSDGIYLGGKPHPRGWGTFARYLSRFVRQRGDWDWAQAAVHLAARPADILGWSHRGRIQPGAIADAVVLDPAAVRDTATYRHPRRLAQGVLEIFVTGRHVLHEGELTDEYAGQGIRG